MQTHDDYFGMEYEEKTQEDSGEVQLVSFLVGEEEFGADILMVEEIVRMMAITRVPNAPHFVEGVISLRGRVIPIIDLRRRLNVKKVENSRKTRIIIVEVEGKVAGFIVDSVSQVLRIPKHTIEPPPAIVVSGIDSEYITGVSKLTNERLLILLDFRKILTIREQKELGEVDS
jgi:purine-binding chemotaxis protein CheW